MPLSPGRVFANTERSRGAPHKLCMPSPGVRKLCVSIIQGESLVNILLTLTASRHHQVAACLINADELKMGAGRLKVDLSAVTMSLLDVSATPQPHECIHLSHCGTLVDVFNSDSIRVYTKQTWWA